MYTWDMYLPHHVSLSLLYHYVRNLSIERWLIWFLWKVPVCLIFTLLICKFKFFTHLNKLKGIYAHSSKKRKTQILADYSFAGVLTWRMFWVVFYSNPHTTPTALRPDLGGKQQQRLRSRTVQDTLMLDFTSKCYTLCNCSDFCWIIPISCKQHGSGKWTFKVIMYCE